MRTQPVNVQTEPIGRLVASLAPAILDIGARGGADEDLLSIAWASHMICLEPDEKEAAALTARGDARWREFRVLPLAAGGTSGPRQLYVPEDERAASLLQHDPAMLDRFARGNLHRTQTVVEVKTTTLDAMREEGRIGRADFMKIDVEGAELEILKAGAGVLQDCVALKVECSFLRQRLEQPLIWDVMHFLAASGFEAVELRDIHYWRRTNLPAHPYRVRAEMEYSRGQAAQCDVILLRAASRVQGVDQALRLVILSAALGFFDYAVTVLRQDPGLAVHVQRSHGFDLETELRRWSAATGKRVAGQSLKSGVRALVPLLRAWTGRLPFPSARQRH